MSKYKRFTGDELKSKNLHEHPDGIFTNDLIISDDDLEEGPDEVYNPKPFRDIILHDYTYPNVADTRMGSQEIIIKITINSTLVNQKIFIKCNLLSI